MGLWDRFGRGSDAPSAGTPGVSTDEQAIARYRYMLRTAPPEAIEAAHAEAFAALTPEQRRHVLGQLKDEMPEAERTAAAREGDNPGSLAQLATRAEIRQPGAMERIFGGMPTTGTGTNPGLNMGGFGGLFAGSFLSSMAGSVLGSMVAQHFFHSHPEASRLFGGSDDQVADRGDSSRFDDLSRGIDHSAPGDSSVDDLTGFGGDFDGGGGGTSDA